MEIKKYPSNSHTAKNQTEKEELSKKIVTGKVLRASKAPAKTSLLKKFIKEDLGDIGLYLLNDVLIPGIKDVFADMMRNGIEKAFYGEVRTNNKSKISTGSHINYSKPDQTRNKAVHHFDDIILATRAEAERVLDTLVSKCRRYDEATVADLYELVGISVDWTDRNYGWTNLASSTIRPVREGYMIVLPKTVLLR